ncbi:zf-HC2 domain-containing protein [Lysinibacillus cavernae]|uniref:zf-HC2 domain-containing protein n=1 Tax=Lysinibacillus cavernae TaxID=2666135 RepID=UPI0012D995D4|nr:zf-HC2 domain-containing protein [Lysinibacillus cavernae]
MRETKCTIIQDVLPLYIDEVVSQDTKEMIEEHLLHCEKCQKEFEAMRRELFIPAENKASIFKKINKKWRNKKLKISIISVLATAFILYGVFASVFYYETVIPYSKNLIKIEKQNDNKLISHYYGKGYSGVHATYPRGFEIDGEKKIVSFIYYTKTIADSPSRNLSRNLINNENNEREYIFNLPESGKIDAVYYVEFDSEKITAGKDSWESILERAELIWEK